MAGAVTKDLIDISTADATTGWSGTSGQADSEAFKQGSAAYTYQTGKNNLASCTFTPAANINMTTNYSTPHLYWTMRCDVFPFTELLNTGATNSGLMLRVTDGSGNYTQWHVAGKDTWDGSWKNFILDLTNTANVHSSSGTLSLTDVDIITWYTDNSNSGTIRIIDNTWLDAVRYGDGLIANSATTEAFSFQDIADIDFLTANYYGVIQEKDGVLFAQGKIDIGVSGSTANFVSDGETVYFLDRIISTSHHAIVGVNGGASSTDIDITGLVCKTVGTTGAEFDFSDASLSSFAISASTLIDMGSINFGLGTVDATSFSGCGTTAVANCAVADSSWTLCNAITVTGTGTLTDCVIEKNTAASAVLVSDLGDLTGCDFISDGSGHGVELSSIGSGTMTWNNTESGYAAIDGSTGNETIYINVGSGSLTINVSTGASTPTIRTAGATVTVVAGAVIVQVKVVNSDGGNIENANVMIRAADGTGPYPYQESMTITSSGTVATVTHTGHGLATNDKVDISGVTNGSNYDGVKQITVTDANTYTYTLAATQTSPATGTITSTFVALQGLTNASGIISTSRTYATDQPITGWARKSSASPYYKQAGINNTIDSANGLSAVTLLILDE